MATKYLRQLSIFNPDDYPHGVNIIGCGSIGSAVGLALTKLGIKELTLWDGDFVKTHNLPNQLFYYSTIGDYKSYALKSFLKGIDNEIKIASINTEVNESVNLTYPICMVCTDSISSRKLILKIAIKSGCRLLIDGRMAGKIFRVFTVNLKDEKEVRKYKKTFHEDTPQSCTDRSVIFNIFGVSSIMVNQLVNVFQGKDYKFEINFCYENYILTTT